MQIQQRLTDYRKYTTKTINPSAISTKISSRVAAVNYCKWNRNILTSKPFLSGMTACGMHIKTIRVTSQNYWLPPSSLSKFVTNLVNPSLPLGCDVIYGRLQCRKRWAAEQGGLHIYACRRAVEKAGPFDSRTDCVKNFILASFRRSSRYTKWRTVRCKGGLR